MPSNVLVVDDEKIIQQLLKTELEEQGYHVLLADNGLDAVNICREKPVDAILMDVKMPRLNGFQAMREIRSFLKDVAIIIITAFGTIEGAVEAMKSGADEYIVKPFDCVELSERLDRLIRYKKGRQSKGNVPGNDEIMSIIGNSQEVQNIKLLIKKIKNVDTTVLITGESGTGKGVVAKAIHHSSNRSSFPFVHVDCASLSPSLIESELYGYERGAFTGANRMKKGLFEVADRGTVFLDEIGTLNMSLQTKLLNVLQERQTYRIGGSTRIDVDARVIAATNEDLEHAVAEGRFRTDLFYRLNVVRIECPPLRFRKNDIPLLATHFFHLYSEKFSKDIHEIDPDVLNCLMKYNWPGNIRELEHIVESAVVLCEASVFTVKDLPVHIREYKSQESEPEAEENLSLAEQEMRAIRQALERNNGHRENTARELGISRRTLQYRLKKWNIN